MSAAVRRHGMTLAAMAVWVGCLVVSYVRG
jgi:hypothetical protein